MPEAFLLSCKYPALYSTQGASSFSWILPHLSAHKEGGQRSSFLSVPWVPGLGLQAQPCLPAQDSVLLSQLEPAACLTGQPAVPTPAATPGPAGCPRGCSAFGEGMLSPCPTHSWGCPEGSWALPHWGEWPWSPSLPLGTGSDLLFVVTAWHAP